MITRKKKQKLNQKTDVCTLDERIQKELEIVTARYKESVTTLAIAVCSTCTLNKDCCATLECPHKVWASFGITHSLE
jgi:hypothetical protein